MIDPALIPFIQRLDRDPEDDEALDAIRDGLALRGDVSTFALLSEKVAARRSDPRRGAEALHRAADAWVQAARDDRAIPLWRQVLEADPQHLGASLGLAGAWRRAGKLDQAETTYQRLLESVRGGRRVPILQDLAALRAERGDLDGEITALREVVELLGAGAGATEARRNLARLLVQRSRARAKGREDQDGVYDDDAREAARTLAAIAREGATGRALDFAQAALALWPGEERAFQMVLAGTLKHAESVTLRIRFLAANPESAIAAKVRGELADAYVSTGRVDDAVAVLAASATEDPECARQLIRLYERTGRHADLARLLATMPTPEDRRERLVLHRRRASVARTVGDRAGVVANLRRVLDDAPADPEALPEVERDLRVRGALEELRDRLRAAAQESAAEVTARVRWWREVAQLSERRFDAPEEALVAWRAVLADAEEPDDLDAAREGVARALERLGRWAELADARAVEARAAKGDEPAREAWLRWWEIARAHLPPTDALRGLDEALRAAPCDALRAALVETRRAVGDTAGTTAALHARAEAAVGEDAAGAWCELAAQLEREDDRDGALDAWRKAHALDPAREEAWRAEARILEARGDRETLLDVLVAQANHPSAAGRSAGALYGRAMEIAFSLGRDEDARTLAERALRFDPDDAAARATLTALRAEDTAPVPVPVPDADDAVDDVAEAPAAQEDPSDAPEDDDAPATLEPPPAVERPSADDDAPDEPTPRPATVPTAEAVVEDEPTPRPAMAAAAVVEDAPDEDPSETTAAHTVDEPTGSHDTLDRSDEATAAHPVASDDAADEDSGPTGIMSRAALQQAIEDAERAEREAVSKAEREAVSKAEREAVSKAEREAASKAERPPLPSLPPMPRATMQPPPPPATMHPPPPPPRARPSVPPPPPPRPLASPQPPPVARPVSEPPPAASRSPGPAEIAAATLPRAEAEPSIIIDDGLIDAPARSAPPPRIPAPAPLPLAPPVQVAPPAPLPQVIPPPAPLQPLAMSPPPGPALQPLAMNPLPAPGPSLQPLAMNPLPAPGPSLQPLAMSAPPLEPLAMSAPAAVLPSLEMRPLGAPTPLSMRFEDAPPEGDPFDDPFAARTDDPFAADPAPAPVAPPAPAPMAPAAPARFERPMLAMLERALGYRT
jgi:tetratricopeptide (TPR) repeat protein